MAKENLKKRFVILPLRATKNVADTGTELTDWTQTLKQGMTYRFVLSCKVTQPVGGGGAGTRLSLQDDGEEFNTLECLDQTGTGKTGTRQTEIIYTMRSSSFRIFAQFLQAANEVHGNGRTAGDSASFLIIEELPNHQQVFDLSS